ncbi:zinc finger MYND domain-containing protein 12 isoform X2 [Hemitrygon akajei]|uniref:zinc finger MYND domain-containing protein 12 isoform X2 n=1 Tax=Hemitrygon akajei TaxID=2704970 RepID=UPI003BF9FFF3
MLSSSIYPLANPKGVKMECEICQKTAHIMCTQCRVTFYCDVTHQAADWNGIHEKICQLLIPVRMPLPFFSSKKERDHSKEQLVQRQKYLIDLTRTVAQKLLFEGKHEEAIPGALQSMRFASAVYGSLSAELVPSQLLLAEASIGLGRLHEAEEYLSQAQWTMMKTTECINAIQYKLYRNLGLLYTAKCEYDKALWYFADDVTDIWKNFLAELVETEIQKSLWKAGLSSPESGTSLVDMEDVFDASQKAEAVKILHVIFDMRNQELLVKNGKIGNIAHTLAMLYYLFQDFSKAIEYGELALEDNKMFVHKKEIATIQHLLTMAKKALSYPGGKGPSPYDWANSC